MTTVAKIRKFKHTFDSATLNSAPQQSSEIQTSLLQVGMRVRKALSQGYRTHWALEEQKLRSYGLRYKKQDTIITLWEEQPEQAEGGNADIFLSSQESIASTDSSLSAITLHQHPVLQLRMKRGRVNGEEDAQDEERMDAISTHLRPIAQAVSRRKFATSRSSKVADDTIRELDFEDAIFLDPKNQG